MTKSKFDRIATTRTDTLMVSDQRVMDQFVRAVAEALDAAESAVSFAGALSDRDLSLALARLDLLQATAERGLHAIKARMLAKPANPTGGSFLDEFSLMEEVSEFASDHEDELWEDMDSPRDEITAGLISVAEAAQILGMSGEDVTSMMNQGSLQAVASSGQIKLQQSDVQALKERRRTAKPTHKPLTSPVVAADDDEDFDQILARLFDAPELQES